MTVAIILETLSRIASKKAAGIEFCDYDFRGSRLLWGSSGTW